MSSNLITDGYCIRDNFLSETECEQHLAAINAYRLSFPVPKIFRNAGKRPLNYSVIDGIEIEKHLRGVHGVLGTVGEIINDLTKSNIVPLADARVACNINITGKGGTYRWHYDRNRYTALLYLNQVAGGETDMYPNHRWVFGKNVSSRLQHASDKIAGSRLIRNLFGKNVVCPTAAGRLVIMRGDRCLHSVRPVTGNEDRINIILSYDVPGKSYNVANELDSYLYSEEAEMHTDPNYSNKVR